MRYALIACLALTAISVQAGPLGIFDTDKKDDAKIKSSFQSFRYDKTAEWERLKKISVKQVDVSHLANSPAWLRCTADMQKQMKAALPGLADCMRSAFCDELKSRSGKSWELVETPDDETAVLQLSITRLIPQPDAFADGDRTQTPSISFDGQLVDKKTGKTVMSFSETKNCPAPVAGAPLFGDCKEIVKGWAAGFAEMSMPDHEAGKDRSRLRRIARIVGGHFALRKFMQ